MQKWNTDNTNFGRLYSLLMGSSAVEEASEEGIVNKVYSITYTQTETMERKWTNLKKKEPIEAFDTFVEEWNAEGGAEITEEVQALTEK